MAVKKVKQPGVGTREPINKQPGVGTQDPMKQEHSQQQANTKEFTKQFSVTAETKTARRVGADVPEVVPQSEIVDGTRRSGKDVDAEAQGPEHHGAYLEPVMCLR